MKLYNQHTFNCGGAYYDYTFIHILLYASTWID